MKNKKGIGIDKKIIVEIILICLIASMFLLIISSKTSSRGLKQQVIEKQTVLLINSAVPKMSFELPKLSSNGKIENTLKDKERSELTIINNVEIKDDKLFIEVDGLPSQGLPITTPYKVTVTESQDKLKYLISIK